MADWLRSSVQPTSARGLPQVDHTHQALSSPDEPRAAPEQPLSSPKQP